MIGSVFNYQVGVNNTGGGSATLALSTTFETISKNLNAYPYGITYGATFIQAIVYNIGTTFILKSFGFSNGLLYTIQLSGGVPSGVL